MFLDLLKHLLLLHLLPEGVGRAKLILNKKTTEPPNREASALQYNIYTYDRRK
jgi:hypothetical protein